MMMRAKKPVPSIIFNPSVELTVTNYTENKIYFDIMVKSNPSVMYNGYSGSIEYKLEINQKYFYHFWGSNINHQNVPVYPSNDITVNDSEYTGSFYVNCSGSFTIGDEVYIKVHTRPHAYSSTNNSQVYHNTFDTESNHIILE